MTPDVPTPPATTAVPAATPLVRLVLKRDVRSDRLETTAGVEVFSLHPSTSGRSGVTVDARLPGLYRTFLPHPEKFGEGVRQAARDCADTYRNWIKDNLGLDVTVQLTDTKVNILWCTACGSTHPAMTAIDEHGEM